MIGAIDPAVLPGLLLLAAELAVLAAFGYVVVRVALRQADERMALAQGLVVGPALWGGIVNFVLYVVPGLTGAAVGWGLVLALGAGLAWRTRDPPRLRTAAGLAVVALVLFVIVLAGRQMLSNPDPPIHHGLIATMRAGGPHPPELPWNPGLAAPYHYGPDLLIGLMTPPVGPDPAFVTELMSTYIWVSYVLIVATVLLRYGSWIAVVVLGPLLLVGGTQTFLAQIPGVLQIPVPAGMPAPGLRASLESIYLEGNSHSQVWPPNIWKPNFVLAYAMALVVLERAAPVKGRRWPRHVSLALLVGFLGLVDAVVALIVLVLWGALEAVAIVQARRVRPIAGGDAWGAAGPALAALLLISGGGAITSVLDSSGASGLSLGWVDQPNLRPPLWFLWSFAELPGGIGLLALGPVALAAAAAGLVGRDRLGLALAAAAGAFVLLALTLVYEYAEQDVTRIDGYARNFAIHRTCRMSNRGWRASWTNARTRTSTPHGMKKPCGVQERLDRWKMSFHLSMPNYAISLP